MKSCRDDHVGVGGVSGDKSDGQEWLADISHTIIRDLREFDLSRIVQGIRHDLPGDKGARFPGLPRVFYAITPGIVDGLSIIVRDSHGGS